MAFMQYNIEKMRPEERTNYKQLAFEIREKRPGFKGKVVIEVLKKY